MMNHISKPTPKFNGRITNRVMELHKEGFDCDFFERGDNMLISGQSSMEIVPGQAYIKLIDQCLHRPSNKFIYLHTVETSEGEKGLLLSQRIRTGF